MSHLPMIIVCIIAAALWLGKWIADGRPRLSPLPRNDVKVFMRRRYGRAPRFAWARRLVSRVAS